jgi:deazaflavin-dependent oxidoreductase (nitroreductase family)
MTQTQTSSHWWYPINKTIASIRPISWTIAHTFHHLDRAVLKLSGGNHTATTILIGLQVVTLTAVGAKSGEPRSVPLIAFPDGDNLLLIASNWGRSHHPAWYYNLSANPEATVSIKGQSAKYIAHEAGVDERERCWDIAVGNYAGYAAYERRAGDRRIPVMVLEPLSNA